jgi:filamentous hemagglutinin family protein
MSFKLNRLCVGNHRIAAFLVSGVWFCCPSPVPANPMGAVVTQGSAAVTSHGSTLTVQTGGNTFINWSSFNIGVAESTVFVQPSATSVVWNRIDDPNPSQILGTLDANGYVILQNPSGFYVGGQAAINAAGLIMTTAPTPPPDLSGGGAWQFNALPPTAKIINYGQISIGNHGSAYLIANDIENNGSISAPGGNIGLYAGQQVLLSDRPDGRGLSAAVTLPQGSVDNSGKLVADAGTIALNARVVNQGGLIQANSIQEQNGVIELVAGDSLNLSASSVISAKGDSQGTSSGGNVTIKSGNQFLDNAGSVIDFSGGTQGGNGGALEISAAGMMNGLQSRLLGSAASGWEGGSVTLDPGYVTLVAGSSSSGSGSSSTDPLLLGVGTFAGMSQISVQATQNLELATLWNLSDSATPAALTLQAGANLTADGGAGIAAGKNWTLNLTAGADFVSPGSTVPGSGTIILDAANPFKTSGPAINLAAGQDIDMLSSWNLGANTSGAAVLSLTAGNNVNFRSSLTAGQDWSVNVSAGNNFTAGSSVVANQGGIYVNSSTLTTADGSIDLNAFNEVKVTTGSVTTTAGGNITVFTTAGNVTTGTDATGYAFKGASYAPSLPLGGISTAAGGNVTITAGQDVISYPAATTSEGDAGSGAFGLNNPGVVTVTAARNVTGHFVAADSVDALGNPVASTITAGQNAGTAGALLSLSLVKGGWQVNASSIDLQEVRNPNGIFNSAIGAYNHLFDYDPRSFVDLVAANSVELNGTGVPRGDDAVNVVYPPSLSITAGPGGVMFDSDVVLFPSPDGNLSITTTGGGSVFAQQSVSTPQVEAGNEVNLIMSDTAPTQNQWTGESFGLDNAVIPVHLNDPIPVVMNISGNLNDMNIVLPKQATITVGGNMENSSFSGQNLHSGDVTSITVTGQLFDRASVTYEQLGSALPVAFNSDAKLSAFIAGLFDANGNPLFPPAGEPVFFYNPVTLQLAFTGSLTEGTAATLTGPIYQAQLDAFGRPEVVNGHALAVVPATFIDPALINYFVANTMNLPSPNLGGYGISGPGTFNLTAGSMTLADPQDQGVSSFGASRNPNLAPYAQTGANINITTTSGDLSMFASTINTLMGGNITIISAGAVGLGTAEDFGFSAPNRGVYTEAGGNVSVTAVGDINLYGSRIATFDGGNITVASTGGSVDAGNGTASDINLSLYQIDPVSQQLLTINTTFSGSGIEALTLPLTLTEVDQSGVSTTLHSDPNAQPGNITVSAYHDITASEGGIVQEPLNGNEGGGPAVTLTAGTRDASGHVASVGNIDVTGSGVIGGAVTLNATGSIAGLVIGRQATTVTAVQSFSGTVLSGGTANLSAGGSISGTVFAVGAISVGGGATVSANLQSSSVSVGGGQAQSTLAPATASSTSTAAAGAESNDAKTATGSDSGQAGDDPLHKKLPLLARLVKRVTVILPKT